MYLSDRDAQWAIDRGLLLVESDDGNKPKVDPSSIDLRLDRVEEAKIWDIEKYERHCRTTGNEPALRVGSNNYKYGNMSQFLVSPGEQTPESRVYRDGSRIFVRPNGFLLWQTKEVVGTPKIDPRFICFIDGKSTRARTGLLVHLTAPTIQAGWSGNVTLEIANLGPFTYCLCENDVIAQITVATISSPPERTHEQAGSSTINQTGVHGADVTR